MAKIFTITAATAIVGVALYAGAGYVAVPYIVKIALERTISQSLHRQIQLSDVSFDPWTWRLDIADLKIASLSTDANATPLLSIPLLRLDFSKQSVRHFAPVLDEVTVDGLKADIALSDPDIHGLLQKDTKEGSSSSSAKTEKGLPDFALYNITVKNAMVHVTDKAKGLDQSITDFNLSLPFVSTLPGSQESLITPSLSFNLNGSTIYATGSTKPFGFTLEARLNFNVRDLDITPFTKLVPSLNTPVMQLNSGKLTSNITVVFRNPTGGNPGRLFMSGTAQVRNISTSQTNNNRTDTFFTVGNATLKIKQLDLISRKADIEAVSVDNVKVNLSTDSTLFAKKSETTKGAANTSGKKAPEHPNWNWTLDSISISNAQVDLINTGLRKKPALSLSETSAAITRLSSDPAAERANIKFSSKLLGGSIVAQGALAGSTLDGAVDVSVKQLNLAQTNSFIQTYMRGALAGTLGSSLKVNINKGTPSIAGQVTLNDFSIKQGREQPFTLKALQTNIESISFVQKKALIKEVKLIQPALQLTQYRNGLNFNLLFSPLLATSASATATNAPGTKEKAEKETQDIVWHWAIKDVLVSSGSLRYTDQTTRPNIVMNITPVQLSVKNLDSQAKAQATFSLNTVLAQGKVNAKGDYNLEENTLRTNVDTNNIQLHDFSTLLLQKIGVGTKTGVLTSKGIVSWNATGEVGYQGDVELSNVSFVNTRNTALGSFTTCNLTGVNFSKKDDKSKAIITRVELNQPLVKETKRVQELAGIASIIAKAAGHEKTAERLQKADQAFNNAKLTLNNVTYENGQFSAKGLDSSTLAGKLLERIAESLKK